MHEPITYTSTGFAGRTVSFDDIVRFEATDKYTTVYTSDGLNPMLISDTLKDLERKHPEMVKPHRSHLVKAGWIVNMCRAEKGNAHFALRLGKAQGTVPVSRRMADEIRNLVGDLHAERRKLL
jgi:DNA-binding LytR/AlgR family response regulator